MTVQISNILELIRIGLTWCIVPINNTVALAIGLINPRDYLICTFGYRLKVFPPYEYRYSKFRRWFESTDFGWWWTITRPENCDIIKDRLCLRILVRIKFILILPLECMYTPICYKIGIENRSNLVKEKFRYVFNIIKRGNFEVRSSVSF